jgi:drug/metabolite transporter (DMT)-like permease
MTDAATPVPAPSGGASGVRKVRNPWAVIGLSFITCGIYFLFWTYYVFTEMKDETGEGVGGPIGVILGIFIGIVNVFLIPHEAGNMYQKSGQTPPVTWVTGFWQLIPIVGFFIWVIKVQNALNARWESR